MAKKNVTTIPATISRFTAAPINTRTKRRVAGYARVSTDMEDQQTSYAAQCDYYTNYIKSREDWEFVALYSDEGISATSTKYRDGFKQMIDDALAGKIDLIITKSVSRFARNTVDSLSTIFKLCIDGFGPTQIAKRLTKEKVLTPMAYKAQKNGELLPQNPFKWAQNTVARILERMEYIGHTENFKTTSKNYRSKKRVWNDKENRRVFEDTHPAIVDKHTFETVQEIRKHKRRPTATGKISIFAGKVFCADCGAKLHYCTANAFNDNQDFFVCANYRSNTGTCTGHYIRAVTLYRMVFQHTKNVLSYIQQFEASFVRKEREKANMQHRMSVDKAKVDIVTLKRRDEDLDTLFKRIYEDMVSGRISAERFDKLSLEYEDEQRKVKQTIEELQALIDTGEQTEFDLQQFLKNVRKYTDPKELTPELLNDLVDKIVIHASDKSSGKRKQKIEIYYKAAGIINICKDDCIADDGRKERWQKNKSA